jgi:hypothetical protein
MDSMLDILGYGFAAVMLLLGVCAIDELFNNRR